tara:strand:+ start:4287 stop:5369 length:1083 start_codon:yes stop_codon:yes gene_type:complete
VPKSISLVEWELLIRIAREASVLPRVAYALDTVMESVPEYAQTHLISAKYHAKLLAQQVQFEAREFKRILPVELQAEIIYLKGAAYTLSGCTAGRGRVFSDIDMLVSKTNLREVEARLSVYAWFTQPTDDYDDMYYRQWAHEIPPLKHSGRGTILDVHHNLVPLISGKAPDINDFTAGARTLSCGARVLSPGAMILHSAVHLFYQEEYHHGFRDLSDLHLLFSEFGCEQAFWDELFILAQKTGFGLELALALRYVNMLFDTHIPQAELHKSQLWLPPKIKLKIFDWIYSRVLQPHHTLCNVSGLGLANTMALVRGHWIKMPVHILLMHTAAKGYRNMLKWVAGKGVNKPDSAKNNAPPGI